uniref:CI116 protein n=1 Tax=Ascaris lumbricoides TaxID=6252 RepID=A0A0M3IRS4_ASCLU
MEQLAYDVPSTDSKSGRDIGGTMRHLPPLNGFNYKPHTIPPNYYREFSVAQCKMETSLPSDFHIASD